MKTNTDNSGQQKGFHNIPCQDEAQDSELGSAF